MVLPTTDGRKVSSNDIAIVAAILGERLLSVLENQVRDPRHK
jgi:hypothetical protein